MQAHTSTTKWFTPHIAAFVIAPNKQQTLVPFRFISLIEEAAEK
jgi:hypothetical protein